jgi:hypothetical protein
MVEVELRIPDSGLRVLNRSPGCSLIGYALVYVFHASSVALFQILGTVKLPVSQFQTSRRNIELGRSLGERNLVGSRVNGEKEVTLPHDVPVLEKYSSERAAHLRAQLNSRDRRELTKEAQPCIKVLDQRLAHHDLWKCRRRSTGGSSTRARRILEPCGHKDNQSDACANPQFGSHTPVGPRRIASRQFAGRQFRSCNHSFSPPDVLFF